MSDDEWAFVAPYLTLLCEDALQLKHDLREVSNGLCWLVRTGADYERLHQTEVGPTFLAFTCLILHQLIHLPSSS